MTLSDKLQLINTYKGDIRTSIANKGVDISSATPLSEYASKIDSISGGIAPDPSDVKFYYGSGREVKYGPLSLVSWVNSSTLDGATIFESDSFALEKTLGNYEISLHLRPFQGSNHIYSIRCSNPELYAYFSVGNVGSTGTITPYYWSSSGWAANTISTHSGCPEIRVVYTFSEDVILASYYVDDVGPTSRTFTYSGIASKEITGMTVRILGDIGVTESGYERYWNGEIFYEGTYIKDLDTGEYVYELVEGSNK